MTGLPPGEISGIALPRTRRPWLVAIGAAVALALSAFTGFAVVARSAPGQAPGPVIAMLPAFPSTASGQPAPGATPGQGVLPKVSTMPATSGPASPSPTMTTARTVVSPSTTAARPTVTATYVVVSARYDRFQGEVTVVNAGPSAISGWQIVVALPSDQITSFSANATGYVSNHILLLQPATDADVVPANGTLSVFFTAYGTWTTPELCTFNTTICGLPVARRRPRRAASPRRAPACAAGNGEGAIESPQQLERAIGSLRNNWNALSTRLLPGQTRNRVAT